MATAFPTALDTATLGFQDLVNGSTSQVSGAHAANATTLNVVSTAGWDTSGYVVVGRGGSNFAISYTGKTGTTLTGCTFGADGTTAFALIGGEAVGPRYVAAHHNDLAGAVLAMQAVMGAGISASYGVLRLIASYTSPGGVSTFDLTGIPSNYKGLLIQALWYSGGGAGQNMQMRFSTGASFDTGNNYDIQGVSVANTTVTGFESIAASSILCGRLGYGTNSSCGVSSIWVPFYSDTNLRKKVLVAYGGQDSEASGGFNVAQVMGAWRNTGAIDGLRFLSASGANIGANSLVRVYGVPN